MYSILPTIIASVIASSNSSNNIGSVVDSCQKGDTAKIEEVVKKEYDFSAMFSVKLKGECKVGIYTAQVSGEGVGQIRLTNDERYIDITAYVKPNGPVGLAIPDRVDMHLKTKNGVNWQDNVKYPLDKGYMSIPDALYDYGKELFNSPDNIPRKRTYKVETGFNNKQEKKELTVEIMHFEKDILRVKAYVTGTYIRKNRKDVLKKMPGTLTHHVGYADVWYSGADIKTMLLHMHNGIKGKLVLRNNEYKKH